MPTWKKISAVALLSLTLVTSAQAQLGLVARADQYYESLSYAKAIELYMQAVRKGEVNDKIIHNLANAYREIGDTKNAEVWYAQAVQLRSRQPIEIYYYAQALMSNEKYAEANNWMRLYNELNPTDTRGVMHVTAGDYVTKNSPIVQAYKISPLSINTPASDFGATFFRGEAIVFASTEERDPAVKREYSWRGQPYLDLYISDRVAGGGVTTPQSFSKALNTKFHEGPLSFTNDGLQVYFTSNNYSYKKKKANKSSRGVTNLKIYRATLAGNDFVNIEELPFNSDEFSVCSPSLSKDGTKLFFASDMPGGYGGYDLYMVEIDRGFFTRPVNLGPDINTEGNENYPFIHESNTLFFASDGYTGLGGYDIYSSKLRKGVWKERLNLGKPVNSPKDDFCFILDSAMTSGYFSSNRDGGTGEDDIYAFLYEMPSEVYALTGNVYDENEFAVPDVTVFIKDEVTNTTLGKAKTDRDGFFSFNVSRYSKYKLVTQSAQYLPSTVDVPIVPNGDVKSIKINLERGVYSVFGTVRDSKSNFPLSDVKISIIKVSSMGEQMYSTRPDGKFEFQLEPNSTYRFVASRNGYLNNVTSFSTVNRESGNPIDLTDLVLTKLEVGLVFEVPKIYWDFGKWDLRPESSESLLQVYDFLSANPNVDIELSSHTDSRGSAMENLDLSMKRAEATRAFLLQRGVNPSRVTAKGYGESMIRNGCFDNIECSEEQHQYNRRTEVKIISIR
ncbi:MAG TPA: carboxypeptidase regulatory-like domain-containing protein [Luteibaculaceae bacterium]|nr:carboxypeptidase regulatory-like domain-containing protein [Luteibaculaceae bacterium]